MSKCHKKTYRMLPCGLGMWLSLIAVAWGLEIRLTLEELALSSEQIVQGTVTRVVYSTTEPQPGIFTKATIQVLERFKGPATDPSGQLTVTLPGGRDPARPSQRLYVSGVPELRPGEAVILFCKRDTLGRLQVMGVQGKYLLRGGMAIRRGLDAEPSEEFRTKLLRILNDQRSPAP